MSGFACRAARLVLPGLIVLLGLLSVTLAACSPGNPSSPTTLLELVMKRGQLIAGVKYDSKPFGYLDADGSLKGYDIELLREIAKRLLGSRDSVTFRQVFSSTRIIALNTHSVDLVAATMSITPERQKLVNFSHPYFVAKQSVAVRQDSAINSLSALSGKTVLYTLGSTSGPQLLEKVPEAKLKGYKSPDAAFAALLGGQGDALTTDNTIMTALVDNKTDVRVLAESVADEFYGLGFRKDATSKTFQEKINSILQAMKQDGTLEALQKTWIPEASRSKTIPASLSEVSQKPNSAS